MNEAEAAVLAAERAAAERFERVLYGEVSTTAGHTKHDYRCNCGRTVASILQRMRTDPEMVHAWLAKENPANDLTVENERLRAIIARALHELDPPAFYGEGSVWNDMLETLPEPTGGSNGTS